MTKKDKTEVVLDAATLESPLSQLLLTVDHDKYRMVSLVTRWAKEIKQRDQSTLPPQDLLAQSLREILGQKVALEDIEKLPPPPKSEKKEMEFTFPTISLKDDTDDEKSGKGSKEAAPAESK